MWNQNKAKKYYPKQQTWNKLACKLNYAIGFRWWMLASKITGLPLLRSHLTFLITRVKMTSDRPPFWKKSSAASFRVDGPSSELSYRRHPFYFTYFGFIVLVVHTINFCYLTPRYILKPTESATMVKRE